MQIIDYVHRYRANGKAWWQRQGGESDITYIAVHHTGNYHRNTSTDEQAMQATYHQHVNVRGWQGLSYHYYIPKSGKIYKTNTHNDITWTDGKNINALAVVLDGHFEDGDRPTQDQINSLQWLLDFLTKQQPQFPAGQNDVFFHGEITPTSCCGKNLTGLVVNYRNNGNLNNQTQKTVINMTDNRYDNEVKQAQGFIEKWKSKYPTLGAGYARARNDIDGPADWGELILNDIAEPLRTKNNLLTNEIKKINENIESLRTSNKAWQDRSTKAEAALEVTQSQVATLQLEIDKARQEGGDFMLKNIENYIDRDKWILRSEVASPAGAVKTQPQPITNLTNNNMTEQTPDVNQVTVLPEKWSLSEFFVGGSKFGPFYAVLIAMLAVASLVGVDLFIGEYDQDLAKQLIDIISQIAVASGISTPVLMSAYQIVKKIVN